MGTICLNSTTGERFIITLNWRSVTCQGLHISHDLQYALIEQKSDIPLAQGHSGFSNTSIIKDTQVLVVMSIKCLYFKKNQEPDV